LNFELIMTRRTLLTTLWAVVIGAPGLAAQAIRNVPRISIDEVKALMAKNAVLLIDVRDPQSFAQAHIPGAINVPFDHIPNHVEAWKTEKRLLVTYCA
jgi:3-mercaptopyruvate sulfurtransferase SseA